MTTAATSLLGLALPVTGELAGTWGDTVNNSITSLLDTAVAGTTTISTDADVTLTTTSLAANQARQAIILWTANGTATRTITAPAQSKIYTVINASAGTQSIVLRGATPTTGVTIVKGESALCAWNGSDFIKISNTGGAASFTNVTVSGTTTLSGLTASTALALDASKNVVSVTNTGTGNNVLSASPTLTGTIGAAALTLSSDLTLSGGSANGVLYLNGSKVATSGSALTFDGTNLTNTGNYLAAAGKGIAYSGDATRIFTPEDNVSGGLLQWASGGVLRFNAGASNELMRLNSTGLGIGTPAPAYKLDVNGQARLGGSTGLVFGVGTAFAGSQAEVYSTSTTPMGLGTTGSAVLRLYTNSTLQATLDASGNLGLGVTPSAWGLSGSGYRAVEVGAVGNGIFAGSNDVNFSSNTYYSAGWKYGGTGFASQYNQSSGKHIWYNAASGTAGNAITFTQAMTLDASGNLLVGTTSSGGKITAAVANNASFQTAASFTNATNADFNVRIQTSVTDIGCSTSTPLTFSTANTERARIDSSGNFVMASANDARIYSPGVYAVTGGAAANMIVGSDGGFYRSTSSLKYKQNINDAVHGLADLLKLRPVTYESKNENEDGIVYGGLIAEEVHAAGLTEFVQYAEDGTPDSLAYGNMVSLCIKAIKELKAEFDAYKASHP